MEALVMPQSSGFGEARIKSEDEAHGEVWSDDLDDLPLASRRESLLAMKTCSGSDCVGNGARGEEEEKEDTVGLQFHVDVKTEDSHPDSEIQNLLPSVSQVQSSMVDHSCDSGVQSTKPEGEIDDTVWSDDLDHIPLSSRRKFLLAMRGHTHGPSTAVVKKEDEFFDTQDSSGGVSENPTWLCIDKEAEKQREDIHTVAGESSLTEKISAEPSSRHGLDAMSTRTIVCALSSVQGKLCSGVKICTKSSSCRGMDAMSSRTICHSLPAVGVKMEPLDDRKLDRNGVGNASSTLTVKSELQTLDEIDGDKVDHMLLRDRLNLMRSGEDSALSSLNNYYKCLESMPSAVGCGPIELESVKPISIKRPRKRTKTATATKRQVHGQFFAIIKEDGYKWQKVNTSGGSTETAMGRDAPICIKRPRKRKRTATDSIETAMEEDAPGLLQVLLDKGITVDEIKLYGEAENDEPLDESFSEDSFADLEDVISKLFSQGPSLIKLAPIKCTKGSKTSYCLACLFSLVEQTRYLQFKKWPVEWGWCRDLQSFIFVFERHRRIVLERPEYGYATYFFELVDTLPVKWQVKRLVTALKLTSCGRVSLLENKALSVGEDVSEGEARVLMEFGWIPNTGLGTMLNYCDRVFHDRRNIEDSSEWRFKIGKLLMDGYNGGATTFIGKVNEFNNTEISEIKQELY